MAIFRDTKLDMVVSKKSCLILVSGKLTASTVFCLFRDNQQGDGKFTSNPHPPTLRYYLQGVSLFELYFDISSSSNIQVTVLSEKLE